MQSVIVNLTSALLFLAVFDLAQGIPIPSFDGRRRVMSQQPYRPPPQNFHHQQRFQPNIIMPHQNPQRPQQPLRRYPSQNVHNINPRNHEIHERKSRCSNCEFEERDKRDFWHEQKSDQTFAQPNALPDLSMLRIRSSSISFGDNLEIVRIELDLSDGEDNEETKLENVED